MMPAAVPNAKLLVDLKVLARFIEVYCQGNHAADARSPVKMHTHDVDAIMGHPVRLCPECTRLLMHAWVKRGQCPMDPKPACKHCPTHCYTPEYRQQIRKVMAYSGRKLVLRGRLDYLLHLKARPDRLRIIEAGATEPAVGQLRQRGEI